VGAPRYGGDALQEGLAQALSGLDPSPQDATEHADDRLRNQQLYVRLCHVAQLASFVDMADPLDGKRMNAVHDLLARLARTPGHCELIRTVLTS
jgi:hypothetical protein